MYKREAVMNKSELKLNHVFKEFKQADRSITILNDITHAFDGEQTYAIMGPSGAGKSTLLHLLAGIDDPTAGSVMLDGRSIQALSGSERVDLLHRSIGMVFQFPYLIRELSVVENVMLPGLVLEKDRHYCFERAEYLLNRVGLHDKIDQKPSSLSGGQQQRVAVARALFNKPSFLLADEPTGSLDEKTGNEIIQLLVECHESWGMGIIINTHEPEIARLMDFTYILHNGKLDKK